MTNTAEALFCEACGYDFTTGTMPRPLSAPSPTSPTSLPNLVGALAEATGATSGPLSAAPMAPGIEAEWVAEVWVDPDWYLDQDSDEPCPSPGLPMVVPLRTRSLLIGRRSRSRNIHPEIECTSDVGVSRRQAFAELRLRNDSEQVAMFVTALQQGEELGAPIVDTLVSIAKDMRRTDAQNARRKAARAVPRATLMITTFMVPATMLLLGAGLLLGSGTDFSPLTGD